MPVPAQVCSQQSTGAKGKDLIGKVQDSLAKVLRGINMACAEPTRYAYLVAQGTAIYWHCGRILYRQGLYAELLLSLPAIVRAIETIDYREYHTRALWLLRLAVCYNMSGRHQEAGQTLQKVPPLARDAGRRP